MSQRKRRAFAAESTTGSFRRFCACGSPLRLPGSRQPLAQTFIPGCVNLAHRDCLNRLFAPYYRSYVVGIRADRSPVHLCADLEFVQNDLEPKSSRTQFLNFWPQPGLIARSPFSRLPH